MPLIEAQLQSDMQMVDGFLRKLQEFLELLGRKDAVYRLSEELLKYFRANWTLDYRIIPVMYAQEIKETLVQHEIPFMATSDSAGNTVIILPEDSGKYEYSPLFEQVFMHHPEFYKQLDNETWCRIAGEDKVNGVISFTFGNDIDAEIFKNKVFADGKGIITTDTVEQEGDKTIITVTAREEDLIDESEYKDAVDAYIDAAVSLTGAQSFARRFAVKNDQLQTKNCMDMLYGKNKVPFVIHDGADKYSDYIMFKDGQCSYFTYNGKEKQWYGKEVKIGEGNRDAVSKMIERHMSYIHNVTVSTAGEFNKFVNRSQDYIRREYVDKQKELFKKVILPAEEQAATKGVQNYDDKYIEAVRKRYPELEGIRPDFSIDFLKKLRADLEEDSRQNKWEENLLGNLDKVMKGRFPDDLQMQLRSRLESRLPELRENLDLSPGKLIHAIYAEELKKVLKTPGMSEENLNADCDKIIGDVADDQIDAAVEQERMIPNLDRIIEREESDKKMISRLQKQCHDLLREERQKNPYVDPETLLKRVMQLLDGKGMDTKKIKVAHQAFDRYEREAANIRERMNERNGEERADGTERDAHDSRADGNGEERS